MGDVDGMRSGLGASTRRGPPHWPSSPRMLKCPLICTWLHLQLRGWPDTHSYKTKLALMDGTKAQLVMTYVPVYFRRLTGPYNEGELFQNFSLK